MPKTILTIDDKTDIRRLVRMTLEFDGYTVLEASSGAEGLALARKRKPDLILLDVMMPEMDGFEVGRILRNDPELTTIPVVMITALDGQADRATGLSTGVRAYLNKPFSPVELLQLIKRLLDESCTHHTATK
ncbi:MAG: response regulator [Burkholderiaceae bacterium]|nr:response regulator [Burkholderiaceae bacterium]